MLFLYICGMNLSNDLVIRAAKGEKIERTPVWLMRQAGRILPEYRAIRNSLSGFKELVETPHLAAEVTIQPVDILDVDAGNYSNEYVENYLKKNKFNVEYLEFNKKFNKKIYNILFGEASGRVWKPPSTPTHIAANF